MKLTALTLAGIAIAASASAASATNGVITFTINHFDDYESSGGYFNIIAEPDLTCTDLRNYGVDLGKDMSPIRVLDETYIWLQYKSEGYIETRCNQLEQINPK